MRFRYIKEFDLARYMKFTGSVFGALVVGFVVVSLVQSRVLYEVSLTGNLVGCNFGPQGNPLGGTCGYFFNNVSVAFISWIGGFAVVGPFYVLWSNSQQIGAYIASNISAGNIPGLAFLVPHGIFEIPAIILSLSLGIYLAHTVLENRKKDVNYRLTDHVIVTAPWFLVVIGLLAVAAFVEANISPQFVEVVAGWV